MTTKPATAAKKAANHKLEDAGEKFVRLALARTQRAIARIRLIGHLGNSGYASTPEQRKRVIDALRAAVDDVEAQLEKRQDKPAFAFEPVR